MKLKTKIIPLCIGVLSFSILLCAAIYAWTEPGSTPTGGNIAAPINTGSGAQGKIGNLGVGTASPTAKLEIGNISSDNWNYKFTGSSSSGYTTTFNQNDTGLYIGHNSSGRSLNLQTNSLDRLTITGAGNVGVGTASPRSALDVRGQIVGGFGARTTAGVADWNDATNIRSGNGYTLLLGTAANGPGPGSYFHTLNFEYNSKDGTGSITQIAIPYATPSDAGVYIRGRYAGTWSSWSEIGGAADYATLTGIPTRTAWSGIHRGFVAEQLSWKNYGNGHTIFDASNGTSPSGTAISNTNPTRGWTATYPTLMGWNGANTYGVRVDSSRVSDDANTVDGWHQNALRSWSNHTGIPGNLAYYDAWYGTSYLASNGNLYMGWDSRWLSETINQDVRNGANPQWGTTYANNWFRSQGSTGWYNESYGGGWYMSDSTWIRGYNNKSLWMGAGLLGGDGGLTVGYGGTGSPGGGAIIAGNVGIGTASPAQKLDVNGYIQVESVNGEGGTIKLMGNNGVNMHLENINGTFRLVNSPWTADIFHVEQNGNTYIAGSASATAFYYTSDQRLKKNITLISDSLEKLGKLNGVYFDWKSNDEPSMGLIAQDVEKVFPEAVATNKETGMKSVDYGKLVAPLIEAMKEQQKEISALKSRIDELELKIGAGPE